MYFERRDSIGGRHISKGYLVMSPDGWWNRELRFHLKARDSVLNGLSGWGEVFPSSPVPFIDHYVRLYGANDEKDIVLDAVLFPLEMHGHHGFHLNGNYGYKTVAPLNAHNLPYPEMIHGADDGDMISTDIERVDVTNEVVSVKSTAPESFKNLTANVEAMDGGDWSDPNSTVTGSSWKPGN
jgi:hypothetical protein